MKKFEAPDFNNKDVSHAVKKGTLSSVPFAGGLVGELITLAFPSSLEKRQKMWMENVESALRELQEREPGLTIQQLVENEEFMSLFLRASQIALRNHQEERLRLLQNSLINFNSDVAFDFKTVFLKLVEELSVSSIVILSYLSQYQKEVAGVDSYEKLFRIFNQRVPLKAEGSIGLADFKFFINELESRGLVRVSKSIVDLLGQVPEPFYLAEYSNDESLPCVKVLPIGENFLSFVYGENKLEFKK